MKKMVSKDTVKDTIIVVKLILSILVIAASLVHIVLVVFQQPLTSLDYSHGDIASLFVVTWVSLFTITLMVGAYMLIDSLKDAVYEGVYEK